MKLDSSTLFVNTGRKPLPAMQKKKKTNKNTVALVVCIAIIAVLCVFVGLILHVWFNYNEEVNKDTTPKVTTQVKKETVKKKETPVVKEEKPEPKEESANTTKGEKTDLSSAATKAFGSVDGEYSFGIYSFSDDYMYIDNTDKIQNSAALGAFLMEYASDAIYLGSFDYSTDVLGHAGRDLMTRAFSRGDVEAVNLMIQHFGTEKLNLYFASQGYENTHFGGTIGDEGSYTTAEDLIKLMRKMSDKTTFFPYSDMYSKMRASTVDDKIAAQLPEGAWLANVGFDSDGEVFDAAIVYTNSGNFIFVSSAQGSKGELESAKTAMAKATEGICKALASKSE